METVQHLTIEERRTQAHRKAAETFELQRGAAGKSSLIERFEGNWALSTIGEEFIRSAAGPTADAT